MHTPEYWQGRMDENLLNVAKMPVSAPVHVSTEYVPVVERVEVTKEVVVEKEVPKYRFIGGWEPDLEVRRRVNDQNGKPDAYRVRAFRDLLDKHRKSMVALALESMYQRFDAKESKDERGVEQYRRTVNSLKNIGINEDNNYADESNLDFYETSYDIHKSRLMHLEKLVSNSKAIAESNLTTTAKQRILPAI